MSYIKIKKIKKEINGTTTPIEIPEKGYIYLGYDDSSVGGIGDGLWIINDDGTEAHYVLSGLGSNPTITSITPSSSYNGDTITIIGENFIKDLTTITFDGVEATTVTFLSPSMLTAVVPQGVIGVIPIVATTMYGVSNSYSYTINYQSYKPVIIPPITPSTASIGSDIYISGYNFIPGATVTWFNGVTGETVANSSTYLTATIPEIASGYTIIYVETQNGKSSPPINYFVENNNPTFTGFSPTSGGIGDTISIYGTNFVEGEVQVRFASVQASNITWVSAGEITADISTGTPLGNINIRSCGTILSGFTVTGSAGALLPTISSISPAGASIGDTVTVSGDKFDGTISITFSRELGTITSQSTTSLSVELGTNIIPGINSVIVTNEYGVSNTYSYSIAYTFGGPVISAFNPTSEDRGRTVELQGSNFNFGSGNLVYFGGVSANVGGNATTSSIYAQISMSSPTGNDIDVKVIKTGISGGSYTKNGFIISTTGSTPTITSVSPVYAKSGDTVHIYGTYLSDCLIGFGTSYPGSYGTVNSIDATHTTATIPYGIVGAGQNKLVNIYAIGENGTYKFSPFEVYAYPTSYPVITSFSPSSGPMGTLVTITGTYFAKYYTDISIFINGVYYVLDNQTYVSNTQITGYIPDTYGNYGLSTIKVDTPIGSDIDAPFTITEPVATSTTTTTLPPTSTTTTTIEATTTTTTIAPTSTTTTTVDPYNYYNWNYYNCAGVCSFVSTVQYKTTETLTVGKFYAVPLWGGVLEVTSVGGDGSSGDITSNLNTTPYDTCDAICALYTTSTTTSSTSTTTTTNTVQIYTSFVSNPTVTSNYVKLSATLTERGSTLDAMGILWNTGTTIPSITDYQSGHTYTPNTGFNEFFTYDDYDQPALTPDTTYRVIIYAHCSAGYSYSSWYGITTTT